MSINMEYTYLQHINYPSDLKRLQVDELPRVCEEVRDFIIQELSHNPGHLASSLGTIELTVALHYVFDTPEDRLIWDVGHQAYAHKILTGRRDRFHTNRQFKGLAPFPTPKESEYDAFIAGHSSNSISAALGEQIASQLLNADRQVVAIIGDGAMTGGLAFEGLNNTSMDKNNLLIILNDNNMAIDPIHGGFTQYLLDITTSAGYNKMRYRLYLLAKRLHLIDDKKKQRVQRFNNSIKTMLSHQQKNIFNGLNLRYFGPADGHNVKDLVRILSEIKTYKGPRVLHIITQKGKGYKPAEECQTIWHAPGEFDVATGERVCEKQHTAQPPLWQEVFGETLLELARTNPKIVGITPAMPSGCSMNILQKEMPERVFDVGIAEGHAVTFSAGLAKEGMLPYCNIYSSFMQRAYDNIIHDAALPCLPVVLCIDRAGIVGADGATHHGLFDLAYLRPIPNITICAPMDGTDLRQMLYTAQFTVSPFAIRYPRGRAPEQTDLHAPWEKLPTGKARCLRSLPLEHDAHPRIAVLSIGSIGNTVADAISDLPVAHYDMRWLKPIDKDLLDYVGLHFDIVFTAEDGVIAGGLGSSVLEHFADKSYTPKLIRIGVNDQFVEHGSTQELYHMLGMDAAGIRQRIREQLNEQKQ
ncbi:MAG: 1-deoxy-D-xylulose-5-phosphate synthase [Paludibacter sp.]|nr:1-deoxy-D-xylulose-5-phosphate synthase [Bacteroidales bacterium]MCM1068884.1 1-deoxy-D-xylulose-5-phosphate synthase [Prevotella sp.]MCM1353145.1 1-deoxy-D-xylulose-5-phosphate synthase [Bacteroides sp.]MCM1442467.1 1-deoxy-D-xylulose-5-phosphate synthase [Muribaculum sp.]MCM1481310.1 1-deoxy-D-xylulose-5-phosphate synthase [Paludibacter sp.]